MLTSIGYGILGAAIFRWVICPAFNKFLLGLMRE